MANPNWKKIGKAHHTFTGYEEISGSYWRKAKDGAKTRGLPFRVSMEYAWKKFIRQKRKCALSGIKLKFNSRFGVWDGNASLDRIDSSKGYIEGNIQWVHRDINRMKTNLKQSDFIHHCKRVATHRTRNQSSH